MYPCAFLCVSVRFCASVVVGDSLLPFFMADGRMVPYRPAPGGKRKLEGGEANDRGEGGESVSTKSIGYMIRIDGIEGETNEHLGQHVYNYLFRMASNGDHGGTGAVLEGFAIGTAADGVSSLNATAVATALLKFAGDGRCRSSMTRTFKKGGLDRARRISPLQRSRISVAFDDLNECERVLSLHPTVFQDVPLHPLLLPAPEAPKLLMQPAGGSAASSAVGPAGVGEGDDASAAGCNDKAIVDVCAALEPLLRDGTTAEVQAAGVLNHIHTLTAEMCRLRLENETLRAHSNLLDRHNAMTRKRAQNELSVFERESLQLLRDEQAEVAAALQRVASLFISMSTEPVPLALYTLQAAPVPFAADQAFDVASFGGVLAHFHVACHRVPDYAHVCSVQLAVTQAEEATSADSVDVHRQKTRERSEQAVKKMSDIADSWNAQPLHESVRDAQHWLQATAADMAKLQAVRPPPTAQIMCIILDVVTGGAGALHLCKPSGKGHDVLSPDKLAEALYPPIVDAWSNRTTVHLLLLGCNTVILWNAIQKMLVGRAPAVGRLHVCYSTCEFPSGSYPIVILMYGKAGSEGANHSLAAHAVATRHALEEWSRIYEPDATENEYVHKLPALEKRLEWKELGK